MTHWKKGGIVKGDDLVIIPTGYYIPKKLYDKLKKDKDTLRMDGINIKIPKLFPLMINNFLNEQELKRIVEDMKR